MPTPPNAAADLIWDDWRSHLRGRIDRLEDLKTWIHLSAAEEQAIRATQGVYQWGVTPYYASLMDPEDPACPIRRQVLPSLEELETYPGASYDPVGDIVYRKTRRVIHKYPDRAIILVTEACASICRHCTRKYHTTSLDGTYFDKSERLDWEQDFQYIENTPQIRDVLLTGGDPLTLGDRSLERILSRLRRIPHVEIIRIGSRFPVMLPQRITPDLCAMLGKYHPIWLNTHFNHPRELTPEAARACDLLLRHGIPVQNQSVLLRGVNDDLDTMRALVTGLVRMRVRPYYIYHCDNAVGVAHFVTSINAGREILRGLQGYTTGFAVPQYVITTHLGKIPLWEEHLYEQDGQWWVVNYEGKCMPIGPAETCPECAPLPQERSLFNESQVEGSPVYRPGL